MTDVPSGSYGGLFKDNTTGKLWLDYNVVSGRYSEKIGFLAGTPFRLATQIEVEALLQPGVLDDPAIGPSETCRVGLGGAPCKYGAFDDTDSGAIADLFGFAGGIVGGNQASQVNNDNVTDGAASLGGAWAVQRSPALASGDPYSIDFNGDGSDEKVVWRPSSGTFFVRFSGSNEVLTNQWGLPGDTPIVGDYDGDSIPDLAVWRPSNGTWYILTSKTLFDRNNPTVLQFGLPGDIAMRVDNDGDGRLDVTVWRPGEGNYYYVKSTNAQVVVEQWGLPGDVPLNGAR